MGVIPLRYMGHHRAHAHSHSRIGHHTINGRGIGGDPCVHPTMHRNCRQAKSDPCLDPIALQDRYIALRRIQVALSVVPRRFASRAL